MAIVMTAEVDRHLAVGTPPLVPEMRLHLAGAITPVWEATEAWLARHDTEPPFWAFCWAGGQAIARWVLDHPEDVRGRRVLDVGCGGGIVALAAARAGAAPVVANDIDPLALRMVEANATLNGLHVGVCGDDLLGTAPAERWDVITVGDVCYHGPTAARLTTWLRARAAEGALVLLGDPGRKYRPSDGLVAMATYEVATTRELESRDVRTTGVWRVGG